MTRKRDPQTRIAVRVSEDLKKEFEELCEKKSINGSALVRTFITNWIEEDKNGSIPLSTAFNLKNPKLLKDLIIMLCARNGITAKEIAEKIEMSETEFNNTFKRVAVVAHDFDRILDPFGFKLSVKEMNKEEFENRSIKLKEDK